MNEKITLFNQLKKTQYINIDSSKFNTKNFIPLEPSNTEIWSRCKGQHKITISQEIQGNTLFDSVRIINTQNKYTLKEYGLVDPKDQIVPFTSECNKKRSDLIIIHNNLDRIQYIKIQSTKFLTKNFFPVEAGKTEVWKRKSGEYLMIISEEEHGDPRKDSERRIKTGETYFLHSVIVVTDSHKKVIQLTQDSIKKKSQFITLHNPFNWTIYLSLSLNESEAKAFISLEGGKSETWKKDSGNYLLTISSKKEGDPLNDIDRIIKAGESYYLADDGLRDSQMNLVPMTEKTLEKRKDLLYVYNNLNEIQYICVESKIFASRNLIRIKPGNFKIWRRDPGEYSILVSNAKDGNTEKDIERIINVGETYYIHKNGLTNSKGDVPQIISNGVKRISDKIKKKVTSKYQIFPDKIGIENQSSYFLYVKIHNITKSESDVHYLKVFNNHYWTKNPKDRYIISYSLFLNDRNSPQCFVLCGDNYIIDKDLCLLNSSGNPAEVTSITIEDQDSEEEKEVIKKKKKKKIDEEKKKDDIIDIKKDDDENIKDDIKEKKNDNIIIRYYSDKEDSDEEAEESIEEIEESNDDTNEIKKDIKKDDNDDGKNDIIVNPKKKKDIIVEDSSTPYFEDQIPNRSEKKFVDHYFPPESRIINSYDRNGSRKRPHFTNPNDEHLYLNSIKFIRPADLNKPFLLFKDGIEPSDANQGAIGDCWAISAIASLATKPELVKRIFKTKSYNEEGFYEMYCFNEYGEKMIIFVDDYFPFDPDRNQFSFTKPNGNELWVMLLEKLIAKYEGGYSNIVGGYTEKAMTFYTGAISKRVSSALCWNEVLVGIKKNYIICASSNHRAGYTHDYGSARNIFYGHAYSVIDAKEYNKNGRRIRMMKLRNPWGQGEWQGDYSDNSPLWTSELIDYFDRNSCYGDDGTFFMTHEDFKTEFDSVSICCC